MAFRNFPTSSSLKMCVVAFAAVTVPVVANAVALDGCDRFTFAHHGGEEGYADLGHGTVIFDAWFSIEGEFKVWSTLVHCESGTTLSALSKLEKWRSKRQSFDKSNEARVVLVTAAESEKTVTIAEVAAELESLGLTVQQQTSNVENCGCAVRYPQHRDGKKRFNLEDLN